MLYYRLLNNVAGVQLLALGEHDSLNAACEAAGLRLGPDPTWVFSKPELEAVISNMQSVVGNLERLEPLIVRFKEPALKMKVMDVPMERLDRDSLFGSIGFLLDQVENQKKVNATTMSMFQMAIRRRAGEEA